MLASNSTPTQEEDSLDLIKQCKAVLVTPDQGNVVWTGLVLPDNTKKNGPEGSNYKEQRQMLHSFHNDKYFLVAKSFTEELNIEILEKNKAKLTNSCYNKTKEFLLNGTISQEWLAKDLKIIKQANMNSNAIKSNNHENQSDTSLLSPQRNDISSHSKPVKIQTVKAAKVKVEKSVTSPKADKPTTKSFSTRGHTYKNQSEPSSSDESNISESEENKRDHFIALLYNHFEISNAYMDLDSFKIDNKSKTLDLYSLYYSMKKFGNERKISKNNLWDKVAHEMSITESEENINIIKDAYNKVLKNFEKSLPLMGNPLSNNYSLNRSRRRSSTASSGSVKSNSNKKRVSDTSNPVDIPTVKKMNVERESVKTNVDEKKEVFLKSEENKTNTSSKTESDDQNEIQNQVNGFMNGTHNNTHQLKNSPQSVTSTDSPYQYTSSSKLSPVTNMPMTPMNDENSLKSVTSNSDASSSVELQQMKADYDPLLNLAELTKLGSGMSKKEACYQRMEECKAVCSGLKAEIKNLERTQQ